MFKKIIKNCNASISKALGLKIFLRYPRDTDKRSFFDATIPPDSNRLFYDDERHKWYVVPISNGNLTPDRYWLGIRMNFVFDKKEHTAKEVSMLVLRNDEVMCTNFSFVPLFRVEWMADINNKRHGQPHWHIYGHPFSGKNESQNFIATIHFAMASQWHNGRLKEDGHYCHLDNSAKIPSWFEGSINYIKTQLEYLDAKMPVVRIDVAKQVKDEIQDFSPD